MKTWLISTLCLCIMSGIGGYKVGQAVKIKPKVMNMKVTAYCPCKKCCGKWSDGMTACGHVIKKGEKFCAAPPEIPFGTIIGIPGYGKVPVLDRGGKIKGNKLDVFFDNHNDAIKWGNKELAVKVWPKGE